MFSIIASLTNQTNRIDAKSHLIGLVNRAASHALTKRPTGTLLLTCMSLDLRGYGSAGCMSFDLRIMLS